MLRMTMQTSPNASSGAMDGLSIVGTFSSSRIMRVLRLLDAQGQERLESEDGWVIAGAREVARGVVDTWGRLGWGGGDLCIISAFARTWMRMLRCRYAPPISSSCESFQTAAVQLLDSARYNSQLAITTLCRYFQTTGV